jgi:hypothetical protein
MVLNMLAVMTVVVLVAALVYEIVRRRIQTEVPDCVYQALVEVANHDAV